jgi:6-pyruvoyltetrahydropterin/6-carboxytetrahydropterin synthase
MRQVPCLQDAGGGIVVFLIEKSFTFSAAHCLREQVDTHKCTNVHGHNYTVTVAVQSHVAPKGMVIDCGLIAKVVEPLVGQLDHSNLNDHFDFETTSENLAKWFYDQLKDLNPAWVEVTETPTIKARYWE